MAISRIHGGNADGVDRVALFDAHAALLDREASLRASSVPPAPAPNGPPPSAALVNPAWRPAFAMRKPMRAGRPSPGRPSRKYRDDAAPLRDWSRMAAGDRHEDAIPGNNPMEVQVQAASVHGRRIEPGHDGAPGAAAVMQGRAQAFPGFASGIARKAVLERARWLAVTAAAA